MRVSATTLESFRLYMEADFMPEAELIETIQGVFRPNKKMMLGQAFGRCLEKPEKYRQDAGEFAEAPYYRVPIRVGEEWVEYIFSEAMMQPCLDVFDRRGVFEAKATKEYGDVTVVAKVDQLLGTGIIENKTKLSQFDFDKYQESYQWRFMLDLFDGATSVSYNVFLLHEDKDDGSYSLKDIEQFTLYPYPDLHQDCVEMVGRFTEYVKQRGLEDVLREKQATWG